MCSHNKKKRCSHLSIYMHTYIFGKYERNATKNTREKLLCKDIKQNSAQQLIWTDHISIKLAVKIKSLDDSTTKVVV